MYQTYAGQILNGKPVISEPVELPENAKFIITFLDDSLEIKTETKTKSQRQLEVFRRFVEANRALDKQGIEPFDEEWDEIMARGITIDSGVDL